jgi:hypothetical protein
MHEFILTNSEVTRYQDLLPDDWGPNILNSWDLPNLVNARVRLRRINISIEGFENDPLVMDSDGLLLGCTRSEATTKARKPKSYLEFKQVRDQLVDERVKIEAQVKYWVRELKKPLVEEPYEALGLEKFSTPEMVVAAKKLTKHEIASGHLLAHSKFESALISDQFADDYGRPLVSAETIIEVTEYAMINAMRISQYLVA